MRLTSSQKKSKIMGKNLKHSLKFFRFVMEAHFEEEVLGPVFVGRASRIGATKEARSQARALTVEEVVKLEEAVVKGQNPIDGMWRRERSLGSLRPAPESPKPPRLKRRKLCGCHSWLLSMVWGLTRGAWRGKKFWKAWVRYVGPRAVDRLHSLKTTTLVGSQVWA